MHLFSQSGKIITVARHYVRLPLHTIGDAPLVQSRAIGHDVKCEFDGCFVEHHEIDAIGHQGYRQLVGKVRSERIRIGAVGQQHTHVHVRQGSNRAGHA